MADAETKDASECARKDDSLRRPMTLHVCTTCRDPLQPDGEAYPGLRLMASLASLAAEEDIRIEAVACLSVCKRPCTIAFSAPEKWTYVFGDVSPENGAETVMLGARLYAESADGIIPWKLRPALLKKGVISRVPPPARASP